jgi:predicted small lipoprotein YifL
MSPRRCDVIASVGKALGVRLSYRETPYPLVPAKAGTRVVFEKNWIPACAGMRGITRILALCAIFACALALTACGRAGPLEPPPGPAAAPASQVQLTQPDGFPAPGSTQDAAAKSGFDAQGNPVATPSQKRSFILDPLLR